MNVYYMCDNDMNICTNQLVICDNNSMNKSEYTSPTAMPAGNASIAHLLAAAAAPAPRNHPPPCTHLQPAGWCGGAAAAGWQWQAGAATRARGMGTLQAVARAVATAGVLWPTTAQHGGRRWLACGGGDAESWIWERPLKLAVECLGLGLGGLGRLPLGLLH